MKISVRSISPNPKQPRKHFDPEALQTLANSLSEHGQVQAITLEARPEGNYWLISGERRWRAAQLLGWTEIEATVLPPINGKGDQSRLMMALVENIHREDMNPVELGQAYQELHDSGLKLREIAEMVGQSHSVVNLYKSLLKLAPEVQQLYADRRLPIDTALFWKLRKLSADQQRRYVPRWVEKGLTGPQIVKSINLMLTRPKKDHKDQQRYAVEEIEVPSIRLGAIGGFPWQPAFEAAVKTCKACDFFSDRNEAICKECPAVVMVRHMTKAKKP